MFQYHPSNPFRSVTWRWERARLLREKQSRSVGKANKDDPYMQAAFKFQVALNNCRDDVDRWTLMENYPDIYAAYLIFRRGDDEERHPMRYAIEARLLASQSYVDIANLLGISVKTVELYEKVFFNVNEKLLNSDYIMTCVIGPSVHAGLSDRDYDLLWKLFGYLYGPHVLDAFISTTSRRYRPETPGEVDAMLAEDMRSTLQRKVAVVARSFIVNPFSQSELLNIYARFLEAEKESGGDKSHDVILQNIQVMMDKLPFSAGNIPKLTNEIVDKHDALSYELRTEELLTAVVHNTPVNIEEVEDIKFPEPKNDKKGISGTK